MASLILNFEDYYKEVARFLGWGTNPTDQQLENAKKFVYRGYRNFIFSINLTTGRKHVWSFLKKVLIITTVSDQWQYQLPSNFKEFVTGLSYGRNSGDNLLTKVSPEHILNLRTTSIVNSYPFCYALIQPNYTPETGNNWQLWVCGNPNGAYDLIGVYIINPEKPTLDTDVLVGGVEASEAIMESCLAVAEQTEDGIEGLHTKRAEELIQKLIKQDNRDIPETVGLNLDVVKVERKRYIESLDDSDVYNE